MELRHLRYFLAVAEHGSLTLAAERLHTVQPSLSRQIRDLEDEVGTPLFTRGARGVELTAAGRVFVDQARLVIASAEAAVAAARRVALPAKPTFSIGFLTGQEIDWLPKATRVLRDELPNIEMRVVSNISPVLAEDLEHGRLDVAFMRREPRPDLAYKLVAVEPMVAVMPADHPLAARPSIEPRDLVGQTFLGMSETAPVLRQAIRGYLRRSKVAIRPALEVDHLAMAMSMIASTRGVAILPRYAENFMPRAITSRPLSGQPPTIELVVGYHRTNRSPTLASFLARLSRE